MAQFDNNEEDTQQPVDVAQYIRQKYLAGVPSAAPQGGDFDGTDPTTDKETPDTSAATETEKADDSDDPPEYSAKGYQDLANSSKADLANARLNASRGNAIANMGQSLATIFQGQHKLDPSVYDNIRAGNNQVLGQATQDRQDLLKNYLMGNNLQRQSVADQRAAETFAHQKGTWGLEDALNTQKLTDLQDENKVDSDRSKLAQQIASEMMPGHDWSKLTAAQFKAMGPGMQDIFNQREMAKTRAAQYAMANSFKEANLAIAQQRLKDAETKQHQLSDKDVGEIGDIDNTSNKLTDALNYMKDNSIETGNAADKRNAAAHLVGIDDPKVSAFRGMVGDMLAEYQKAKAGSRMSDQERAFLSNNMPNMTDTPQTFQAKAAVVKDFLAKKKASILAAHKQQGKDVSQFEQPQTSVLPAGGPKLAAEDQAMLDKAKAAVSDPTTPADVKASAQKVIDHLTSGK